MSDAINRREFLGAGAAGAGAVLMGTGWASQLAMANEQAEWPPKMPPVKPPKVAKEFEVKQIEELLNKIEESLGHYSKIGGPAPPFIKTDDDAIRDCLAQIRNEIKAG